MVSKIEPSQISLRRYLVKSFYEHNHWWMGGQKAVKMHNVICERLLTIWKAPFIDFYVKEALDATGHLRVLCLFVILWTTIYACE